MRTVIESKDPKLLRYSTCGDYFISGESLFIDICKQKCEDYEFLISIHEQIEEYLTRKAGIKEPDIMAHDLMFENEREDGKHDEFSEPGEDVRAPYRDQHLFAEKIERLICEKMGIDWHTYNKELISA